MSGEFNISFHFENLFRLLQLALTHAENLTLFFILSPIINMGRVVFTSSTTALANNGNNNYLENVSELTRINAEWGSVNYSPPVT